MTAAARPKCRDLRPRDVLVWTGTPRPSDFAKVIDRRKDDDSGWWMTDGSGLADFVWDDGTAWQPVSALADALSAVLALHTRHTAEGVLDYCHEDGGLYPCDTLRAITDALEET